jgi:hypothetical protein
LNQPNLSGPGAASDPAIDPIQQQAIVDWVRAGGNLVLWPGDNGLPASGPLLDALPVKSSAPAAIDMDPVQLSEAGLGPRFRRLAGFQLTPAPGAELIEILHGKALAYGRPLGLGRIVIAPINISGLQFESSEKGKHFWDPMLRGMHLTLTAEQVGAETSQPNYSPYQLTSEDQKETDASMRIADKLGDVPGAGSFGFFYVAVALALMMIVVGPVDWFVLKRLGRQPWTWITTTGWIALVTFGAISVGYLLKSGDLHYRTLRYVYQVGDVSVASNSMIGMYSPRTRDYTFAADPDSWWQPAAAPDFGRSDMAIDLDFHQTYQGNVPEPQRINVWSLRFLREDNVAPGPPAISASLEEDSAGHLVGTIKNLTDRPLQDIRVRTSAGIGTCKLFSVSPATAPAIKASAGDAAGIAAIPPFSSARIEVALTPEHPQTQTAQTPYYYYQRDTSAPPDSEMWQVAGSLDVRRTGQMEKMMQEGKWACVYAEMIDPPPAVNLNDHPEALQHHWQFIEALVELKQADRQQ